MIRMATGECLANGSLTADSKVHACSSVIMLAATWCRHIHWSGPSELSQWLCHRW